MGNPQCGNGGVVRCRFAGAQSLCQFYVWSPRFQELESKKKRAFDCKWSEKIDFLRIGTCLPDSWSVNLGTWWLMINGYFCDLTSLDSRASSILSQGHQGRVTIFLPNWPADVGFLTAAPRASSTLTTAPFLSDTQPKKMASMEKIMVSQAVLPNFSLASETGILLITVGDDI